VTISSAVQPDIREALEQALAHQRAGRLDEANRICRQLLAVEPGNSDVNHLTGVVAYQLGHHESALEHLHRALARRPDIPELHDALGVVYRAAGRSNEAIASHERALRLQPDSASAHNNLGVLLAEQGQIDAAVAHFEEAARLEPDSAEAHYNLGRALAEQDRVEQAVDHCRRAIKLRPDYANAYNNLGVLLKQLGRNDEAIEHFEEALRLRPGDPDAHFHLATTLLALGSFERGWHEFEWRWLTTPPKAALREFRHVLWTGEDVSRRAVLLHAEQGLGDTLQFCRYAPLVAARSRKVFLEVPPELARLLEGSMAGDNLAVIKQTAGFPGTSGLPEFDYHCPLLSLPRILGAVPTDAGAVPYLRTDPAQTQSWVRRLSGLAGKKVGLVWAGRPGYPVDRRRSMALPQFAPLAGITGISFVSLQKGEPARQAVSPPPGMALYDPTVDLHDFADTAALVMALDLVIAVDTAPAHLAGALGKPVWLLNRFDNCWRWRSGRDDTAWYPTMRMFRQPRPGDWDSVVAAVAAELARLV
jgi:tetratricopeptide (TPR) repeat protein